MGLPYFTVLINLNSFSYGPLKSTQWVNKGKFILNWNEMNQRGQSLKKKKTLSNLCEVKVILLKMQSSGFSPCAQWVIFLLSHWLKTWKHSSHAWSIICNGDLSGKTPQTWTSGTKVGKWRWPKCQVIKSSSHTIHTHAVTYTTIY